MSCVRASKFLEAHSITATERVSASKKLQSVDAKRIAGESKSMVVMKGKKVDTFSVGSKASKDAIAAMLGATGNLRAPLIRAGNLVLVGFNEDVYAEHLT